MASLAPTKNRAVRDAVHRHDHLTRQGFLERAFTFAFRGLVYAQIWEDPAVDMEALAIQPDSRVVTIASGGCNALSYLTANPQSITAVDLNTAHVALNKLKLAAARHLPDHDSFRRFFGGSGSLTPLRTASAISFAVPPARTTSIVCATCQATRPCAGT